MRNHPIREEKTSSECPSWCGGHIEDDTVHFTASDALMVGRTDVFVDITQHEGATAELVITVDGQAWPIESALKFHRDFTLELAEKQRLVHEANEDTNEGTNTCPEWCVGHPSGERFISHHTFTGEVQLTLEGPTLPTEFNRGDTPEDFHPSDYDMANVAADLVQYPGEAPIVEMGLFHTRDGYMAQLTLSEVAMLHAKLGFLLDKAGVKV